MNDTTNPARMHWFWRAAIALLVGFVLTIATNVALVRLLSPAQFGSTPLVVTLAMVRMSIPLVIYGLLTRRYGPQAPNTWETRCRKCGYILYGITEPRCSECGERI